MYANNEGVNKMNRFLNIFKKKNKNTNENIDKENSIIDENVNHFDPDIYLPQNVEKHSDCNLTKEQRINLVLKGVALGDYAGQPYEASSLSDCQDMPIEDIYKISLSCTDDTILTCATIDAIQNIKDYGSLYRKYAKKYKDPLGGYGARFLMWAYSNIPPQSCGNGSAMRVGPIGTYNCAIQVVVEAYNSAECTHDHPEGIKGAVVTAVCIWMAFHGYTKKEIAEYVNRYYDESPYSPVKSWEQMKSYEKVQGNPAVCQTTVPMAISCFVNSDSYEDCIWKAVQFGWDTDTQAAIAGSIAAAYYKEFSKESEEAWKTIKEIDYIKNIYHENNGNDSSAMAEFQKE